MRDHPSGNLEFLVRRREQLEAVGLFALSAALMFIIVALAMIAIWSL
ncbi:MAG TPA: hypothetical protein VKQ09_00195 [Sphingomonas sp.]|jgi:hypothetical protein|nr:hypothetical protein [Sphingomonas sp.]